jgi:hypothetical protein
LSLIPLHSRWFPEFFGFQANNMLYQQATYRGYAIGVERRGNSWVIFASPKAPDLPILRCYCSMAKAQTEIDAIAEAKCRVDKVRAN